MAVKAQLPSAVQTWGFRVSYVSVDGEVREMSGSFVAPKMDTVYRYLERKFTRITKKVETVEVWDKGMLPQDGKLTLVENNDTSITALAVGGMEISTEVAKGATLPIVLSPYAGVCIGPHTGVHYQPPPPKEVFPALDTYPAFQKVSLPVALHELGEVQTHKFRAKFYDVFPREK